MTGRANCRIADTTIGLEQFSLEEFISANTESACFSEERLDNFNENAIFNRC